MMRTAQPRERGLLRREMWPQYLTGMLVETAFILVLTAVALGMALLFEAVF